MSVRPESAAEGARPSVAGTLGAAILFIALFATRIIQISDPDVFLHIRSGWWILASRAIPRTDPFALFTQGMPWVNHQWLAQVAIALASARPVGGLVMLSLVRAGLITLSFFLIYRALRLRGVPQGLALLCVFVGSLPAWPFSEPRPYLATYVFLAWMAWAWSAWRTRGSRALYFLPLVMLVWANSHGGAAAGLVFMAALAAGEALEGWLRRRTAARADRFQPARRLGLILLLALLASFISPHGWRILLFPFKVVGQGALETRIFEWQAPDARFAFLPFWVYVGLLGVAAVWRWRKLPIPDALAAVVFVAMSLSARRHIPLMVFVTLPMLGAAVGGLRGLRTAGKSDGPPSTQSTSSIASLLPIVAAAAIVVLGLAWSYAMADRGRISLGLGIARWTQPSQAASFILDNPLRPNLFHDYNYGGYLAWRLNEPWQPFIDGRVDIYGAEGTARYLSMMAGRAGWREAFAHYNINTVLLDQQTMAQFGSLGAQLWASPQWALVYWDTQSLLYARRDSVGEDFLAAHEYRAVNPTWTTVEVAHAAATGQSAQLMDELQRAMDEAPGNLRAMDYLSNLMAATGRLDEAQALIGQMLEIEPRAAQARYRLARILDKKGDLEAAARQYRAYLDVAPGHPGALVRLGTVEERQGNVKRALGLYRDALESDPADAEAMLNIARALTLLERYEASIEYWDLYLKMNPGDETAREALEAVRQEMAAR